MSSSPPSAGGGNGYVPNKLRGVMGGGNQGNTGGGGGAHKGRLKGRKSRPWRVDAASWKQELQERKAVYDNFALPEAPEDEEKKMASTPSSYDGSMNEGGGDGGDHIEIVMTPSGSTSTTMTTNEGTIRTSLLLTTTIPPSPDPSSLEFYTPRSHIDRFHASFGFPDKQISTFKSRNSSEEYRNAATATSVRSPLHDEVDDELLASRSTEEEDDSGQKFHPADSFIRGISEKAYERSQPPEPNRPHFRMASAEEVSNIGPTTRLERERELAEQERRMEEMRRLHASPGLVSAVMRSLSTTTTTKTTTTSNSRTKKTPPTLTVETSTDPELEDLIDDYDDDGILASRSPIHKFQSAPTGFPEADDEDVASDASVASGVVVAKNLSTASNDDLDRPVDDLLTIRSVPTDEEQKEIDFPTISTAPTFFNLSQQDEADDDIEDDVQSLVAEALCAMERANTMTEHDDATVKSELMASALSAIETAAAISNHPSEHSRQIPMSPRSPKKRRSLPPSPGDAKLARKDAFAAPHMPVLSTPQTNKEIESSRLDNANDASILSTPEKINENAVPTKQSPSPKVAAESEDRPAPNPDPLQRARKGLLISDLGRGWHKSPNMKDAQVIETISEGAKEKLQQILFQDDMPESKDKVAVPSHSVPEKEVASKDDGSHQSEELQYEDVTGDSPGKEIDVSEPASSETSGEPDLQVPAPISFEEEPKRMPEETEMDVAKKLIFTEMTSRLKTVYTGDYHTVESTGNPEPYKKPPQIQSESSSTAKAKGPSLFAELNAKVSKMYTDHFYVVESPSIGESKKSSLEPEEVKAEEEQARSPSFEFADEEVPKKWIPITPLACSTTESNKFNDSDAVSTETVAASENGEGIDNIEDMSSETIAESTSPDTQMDYVHSRDGGKSINDDDRLQTSTRVDETKQDVTPASAGVVALEVDSLPGEDDASDAPLRTEIIDELESSNALGRHQLLEFPKSSESEADEMMKTGASNSKAESIADVEELVETEQSHSETIATQNERTADQQKGLDFFSEIALVLGGETVPTNNEIAKSTNIDSPVSVKNDMADPSLLTQMKAEPTEVEVLDESDAVTAVEETLNESSDPMPIVAKGLSLLTGDINTSILSAESELATDTSVATAEHSEDASEHMVDETLEDTSPDVQASNVRAEEVVEDAATSAVDVSKTMDLEESPANDQQGSSEEHNSQSFEIDIGGDASTAIENLFSENSRADEQKVAAYENAVESSDAVVGVEAMKEKSTETTPIIAEVTTQSDFSPNIDPLDSETSGQIAAESTIDLVIPEATPVSVVQVGSDKTAGESLEKFLIPDETSRSVVEGGSAVMAGGRPEKLVGTPPGSTVSDVKQESLKGKKWKERLASKRATKENPSKMGVSDDRPEVEENAAIGIVSSSEILPASPTLSNDAVIQGLPPDKGKKWKDRLAKKRGRKSFSGNEVIVNGVVEPMSPPPPMTERASVAGSAVSELTVPLDENPLMSPSSDSRKSDGQPFPKPGSSIKSQKWKDRLARRRGLIDLNDEQPAVAEDNDNIDMTGRTIVTIQSGDEDDTESKNLEGSQLPIAPLLAENSGASESQTHANGKEETLGMEDPVDATAMRIEGSQIKDFESNEHVRSPIAPTDLQTSFQAFDALLNQRSSVPTDEESVWTEVTVEQAPAKQPSVVSQQPSGDDQSYMEFTVDESLQQSYFEETVVSEVEQNASAGAAGNPSKMISPFMSNLLSSRLYQDMAPHFPSQSQNNKNLGAHFEQTDKAFPTILVNSAHDDDMTQITMDHSLDEDDDEEDAGPEPFPIQKVTRESVTQFKQEKYYDALSKPPSAPERPPMVKVSSARSRRSLKSQKSSGGGSVCSQISSETSKQRIAEILRKDVWSRDISVVHAAAEELNKQAKHGRTYRAHIVRCGGIMAITRTMEMNAKDSFVQLMCCETLDHLSLDPDTQSAICEMAGISLIVRSMQDHADKVEVQEAACSALATICRREEAEDMRESIREANGAVYTLLTSMTRYNNNPKIQAKAFGAIANLCMESRERLAELSEAGGIMTMTLALQRPWENKTEQHEAISSLSILLRGITELNSVPSPRKTRPADTTPDDDSFLETQSNASITSERDDKNGEIPAAVEIKQDGTGRTSNETASMPSISKEIETFKQWQVPENCVMDGAEKNTSFETAENGEGAESKGSDDSLESLEAIPHINTASTLDEEEKAEEPPVSPKSCVGKSGDEEKKEDQCVMQ